VDRDHAVQLQPSAARGVGQGRHSRGGRHAGRVQHHCSQRRHRDGHRRNESVTHLARGRRRLHRARHARASPRRARLHQRLRQDHPRHGHGARAHGYSWAHGLWRFDHARPVPGQGRHDRRRLRGRRQARRREDGRQRTSRAREGRVPRCRRVRRSVHRKHHGNRIRSARYLTGGIVARPRNRPAAQGSHEASRPTNARAPQRRRDAASNHHAARARERDPGGHGDRRIDERGASPPRGRA